MRKIAVFLLCALLIGLPLAQAEQAVTASDSLIAQAYRQQRSNLQIEGEGRVFKLLPDDNRGSRHQRFLIRLASGQTLLMAHNIDLAAKIENLQVGDQVVFFGEYEWSNKGGTVHWTHRDPGRRHVDGWLKHGGKVYQ